MPLSPLFRNLNNISPITGIPLVLGDNFYPFSLKRKQFLVKVAFSITANKREGQTLKKMASIYHWFFQWWPNICHPVTHSSNEQMKILSARGTWVECTDIMYKMLCTVKYSMIKSLKCLWEEISKLFHYIQKKIFNEIKNTTNMSTKQPSKMGLNIIIALIISPAHARKKSS